MLSERIAISEGEKVSTPREITASKQDFVSSILCSLTGTIPTSQSGYLTGFVFVQQNEQHTSRHFYTTRKQFRISISPVLNNCKNKIAKETYAPLLFLLTSGIIPSKQYPSLQQHSQFHCFHMSKVFMLRAFFAFFCVFPKMHGIGKQRQWPSENAN